MNIQRKKLKVFVSFLLYGIMILLFFYSHLTNDFNQDIKSFLDTFRKKEKKK